MKKILLTISILLITVSCKNNSDTTAKQETKISTNETEQSIYRSGDSMLAAFKRKDWPAYIKYNHPNMVKMMGGPEAFASFINMQMKQIPDTSVKYIKIGKILKVVTTLKDKQCLVEQDMRMNLNGVTIDKTTYLIGESLDTGKTWTFFDASTNSALLAKKIKPDISSELKIPGKNNLKQQ